MSPCLPCSSILFKRTWKLHHIRWIRWARATFPTFAQALDYNPQQIQIFFLYCMQMFFPNIGGWCYIYIYVKTFATPKRKSERRHNVYVLLISIIFSYRPKHVCLTVCLSDRHMSMVNILFDAKMKISVLLITHT